MEQNGHARRERPEFEDGKASFVEPEFDAPVPATTNPFVLSWIVDPADTLVP
jgi:hypothetical protein